jgi:hypothetical protein
MSRGIWKVITSIVLAMQLAAGGGIALPGGASVIGQVIVSSKASVGDVPLPGAGTLLDNDLVRTDKDGRVVVDFPEKVRAAIGEETQVRFRKTSGRLVANLDAGTVTALKQEQLSLRIDTPSYSVEPTQSGKAVYMVAVIPNRSTTVKVGMGNVLITEKSSGYRNELREGLYATIPAAPAGLPASPGQEKEASKPAPEQPSQPAPAAPAGNPASPGQEREASKPAPEQPSEPAPAPTAPPAKPPMQVKSMSAGTKAALIAGIAGAGIAGAAAAAAGGGGGGGGGTVSPTR